MQEARFFEFETIALGNPRLQTKLTAPVAALFFVLCTSVPLAQQSLALDEAVELAIESHPAIKAAEAGVKQIESGVQMAKSGRLPKLRYTESYTRSDNPVFVFGSLLNQRQFTEENFDIDLLNNPDALQNFQSLLQVEQPIYDFNRTRHALRAAHLRTEISEEAKRARQSEVILSVVKSYFAAVLAQQRLHVTDESVRTAQSDLSRAVAMNQAGMATRADVLSAKVHLAAVEEESIRARNELTVAEAALAESLGLSQVLKYDLVTPLSVPQQQSVSVEDYVTRSASQQPDLKQRELGIRLADEQMRRARSELWPEIVFQGALEADRQRFASRGGGNWLVAVALRWDIWSGSEKRARVSAAEHGQQVASALQEQTRGSTELMIRRAFYELESARARVDVSRSSVEEATEGHRIVQNRYEADLEQVTELIRSQEALMRARFRHLAALHDVRVAWADLEHSVGSLTPSSEALK